MMNKAFFRVISRSLVVTLAFLGMHGIASAKVMITTENYPPFNIGVENDPADKITGISTEIIRELFKRAKVDYDLRLLPWARAYKMGMDNVNTAVYSTTRTPEREKLFKWVGPVAYSNWAFFAKEDSNIVIQKLDDAKKYRVGGYIEDAVSTYLVKNGFKLELTTNETQNAKKLVGGRYDVWATGELLGQWIAKKENLKIKKLYTFNETEMYLAFNLKTDDKLIDQLNSILKDMKKEGFQAKVNSKYK